MNARRWRGEVEHARGDLHRLAHAAQRGRADDRLQRLLGDSLGHPGLGEPRGDGVDRDPLAGIFAGQGLGQADHARLGGRVVGLAEVADLAVHAGDVDHPAPAALGHLVDELLGHQEDAGEVGVDDLVPGLLGQFLERPVAVDARVVDQDVDAAEVALDLGAHRLDLLLHRDVVGVVLRLAAQAADAADRPPRRRRRPCCN